MDLSLKQRLLGAVVLIALAVIFVPMFLSRPAPQQSVRNRQPRDSARAGSRIPEPRAAGRIGAGRRQEAHNARTRQHSRSQRSTRRRVRRKWRSPPRPSRPRRFPCRQTGAIDTRADPGCRSTKSRRQRAGPRRERTLLRAPRHLRRDQECRRSGRVSLKQGGIPGFCRGQRRPGQTRRACARRAFRGPRRRRSRAASHQADQADRSGQCRAARGRCEGRRAARARCRRTAPAHGPCSWARSRRSKKRTSCAIGSRARVSSPSSTSSMPNAARSGACARDLRPIAATPTS